jgi:hypothetical protein
MSNVLDKWNKKWSSQRLELLFDTVTTEVRDFFQNTEIKYAYTVEHLEEYSDEGYYFDLEVRFENKKTGESFRFGRHWDGFAHVGSGYWDVTDIADYLDIDYEMGNKIDGILCNFGFDNLVEELKHEKMENSWDTNKERYINQKVLSGGFDTTSNTYYLVLENGERVEIGKETSHIVEY